MKPVLISAMVLMGMASWAQAQTPQQWDQCVERVGRTVDVQEVGQIGYENAIKDACGVRPVSNAGMAKPDGKSPFDVVQAAPWKARFQQLTGKRYQGIKDSLAVSSAMQREGAWLVGSGYDPRGAGASKAVIAVNTQTGKVLAAYTDSRGPQFFGFNQNSKGVPAKVWQWVSEETAAG